MVVLAATVLCACGEPEPAGPVATGVAATDAGDGVQVDASGQDVVPDVGAAADALGDPDGAPDLVTPVDGAPDGESDSAAEGVAPTTDAADSGTDATDAGAEAAPDSVPEVAPDAEPADAVVPDTQADAAQDASAEAIQDANQDASADDVATTCVSNPLVCDDANPCTQDECDPAKGCKHVAIDGKSCNADDSACTPLDSCGAGICKPGAAKVCAGEGPCVAATCNPATGACSFAAKTGACNDGDTCTSGDVCKNGACVPGTPKVCDDKNPCTSDTCAGGDCAFAPNAQACDDGNPCTAADKCAAGACQGGLSDPAKACDDNNPCTTEGCNPVAGCSLTAKAGGNCDDGNPCTVGDVCSATGLCTPGADSGCGCSKDADCPSNDKCLGTPYCDKAKLPYACKTMPGTAVVCDTSKDGPCGQTSCDPKSGACGSAPANAGKPCDDGSVCSSGESCTAGKCAGSGVLDCNDTKPCTQDSCDPKLGCQYKVLDAGACDDGDACSKSDACSAGICKGTPMVCDDGNTCTTESCAAVGCVAKPLDGGPCGPVSGCGVCKGGACQAGGIEGFSKLYKDPADKDRGLAQLATVQGGGWLLVGTTPTASNGTDGLGLRVDGAGALTWTKTFGGKYSDTFSAVAALADGSFAIVGSTSLTTDTNNTQAWFTRIDAAGTVLVDKAYGDVGYDGGYGVASNAAGVIVSGARSIQGATKLQNNGWVAQLSGLGVVTWEKFLGINTSIFHVVGAGDLVVAGVATYANSQQDAAIKAYSSFGNEVWSVDVSSPAADSLNAIAQGKDGVLNVLGASGSSGNLVAFIARISPVGKLLSMWTYPDMPTTYIVSLTEVGDKLVGVGTVAGGVNDAYLWAANKVDGKVAWQKPIAPFGGPEQLNHVVAAGTGFAAVGTAKAPGQAYAGWLVLLNGNGEEKCQ